ncbi:hypothetical protein Goshw_006853 [Gossypium schwendimanii]|uniref:Uncharacterized protein n=1 Tax=Gossypium schwendimanii TaxID=34291 RepID=A0A7J9LU83_GOSSC|nr:hypothetical protein [Gossypium schwendimanii]
MSQRVFVLIWKVVEMTEFDLAQLVFDKIVNHTKKLSNQLKGKHHDATTTAREDEVPTLSGSFIEFSSEICAEGELLMTMMISFLYYLILFNKFPMWEIVEKTKDSLQWDHDIPLGYRDIHLPRRTPSFNTARDIAIFSSGCVVYLLSLEHPEGPLMYEENEKSALARMITTLLQNRNKMLAMTDTDEVENKAINTIVEHESSSVNFQHQMEARKFSEDVYITKEIHDCCEEENSTKVEFVIPSLGALQEMQKGEFESNEKRFKRNIGKQPELRQDQLLKLLKDALVNHLMNKQRFKGPTVPPIVHEYYANLKFVEEDNVYVRGREVETSPPVISKYYRVSFLANDEIELLETRYFKGVNVDSIMLYLTEGRGE